MADPLQQLGSQFAGLWVQQESPHGQVFVGRDALGVEVSIAVLNATAAADPALRNAFADTVWRHSVGSETSRATVYAADLHAPLPWAAVRAAADQPGAGRLLDELTGTAPTSPIGFPVLPGSPATPTNSPTPVPGQFSPPPVGPAAFPGAPAPGAAGPWHPAATRSPAAPPGPPGSPGPAARRSGAVPWLLGLGSAAVVLVLLVVGSLVALRVLGGDGDSDRPPVTGPTGAPVVTGPPTPTGEPGGGGDDEERTGLRSVEQVDLFGPNFGRSEETYTMQLRDFPFAFRTPLPWNCIGGTFDPVPDAPAHACVGDSGTLQRVNLVLWECEQACSAAEQADMLEVWLDEPGRAVSPPGWPTIIYVEQERNDRGRFDIDLAHFITEPGGSQLRWMLGVYVESPLDTRDEVLKILNDIISQTA